MIRSEEGIQVKYLEGGIMYIWFFTDKAWIPYYLNPTCEKGTIRIDFQGIKDAEYIEFYPEFDSNDYIILSEQSGDLIKLVCVPKNKVGNAVPFFLKRKAAEEAA